jgi:hypothetical protein
MHGVAFAVWQRNIQTNIRAVYYKHKSVFRDMSSLLTAIHYVMDLLQCTREALRMPACVQACIRACDRASK